MSEPFWTPLGGGGAVDYEGTWAAGTAYIPGDVVVYNGINYLAVNPSTGVTPAGGAVADFGTVLPTSPTDGQEFTLVDSLSAPTWAWKLRYVAAKSSNKWVFIGGSAQAVQVDSPAGVTSTTYAAYAGVSLTTPVTGVYSIELSAQLQQNSSVNSFVAISVNNDTPSDTHASEHSTVAGSGAAPVYARRINVALTATQTVTAKAKSSSGTVTLERVVLSCTPIAIGG